MKPFVVAVLLMAALEVRAQSPIYAWHGDSFWDGLGRTVARAGDVDGDGYQDLLVSFCKSDRFGALAGSVRVYSGLDGRVLLTVQGDSRADDFGFSADRFRDYNGDGYADLIVGAPGDDNGGSNSGSVRIVSGKDGLTLKHIDGRAAFDRFGYAVSCAGDVDKDGVEDFVVGAFQPLLVNPANGIGYAMVFSGKDGRLIRTLTTTRWHGHLGWSLAAVGDVDRDGHADLLVGAPAHLSTSAAPGRAYLFSGKSGTPIKEFVGIVGGDGFGYSVAGGGDINRDGWPDLIIGAYRPSSTPTTGAVRVVSGKDFSVLHALRGSWPGDGFGRALGVAGDADGDGFDDFLVGAPYYFRYSPGGGSAILFSGRTGGRLFTYKSDNPGDRVGESLVGGVDLKGDGYPDFVVGVPGSNTAGNLSGRAHAFSTRRLPLTTSVHQLNLIQAGKQDLSIDAGVSRANYSYWVFGSTTGIHPRLSLWGLQIPLVPDFYTEFTIAYPNSYSLSGFRGQLDASGKALASLVVPAGLPALKGFTLHHAAVIYASGTGFFAVTNSASLRLE